MIFYPPAYQKSTHSLLKSPWMLCWPLLILNAKMFLSTWSKLTEKLEVLLQIPNSSEVSSSTRICHIPKCPVSSRMLISPFLHAHSNLRVPRPNISWTSPVLKSLRNYGTTRRKSSQIWSSEWKTLGRIWSSVSGALTMRRTICWCRMSFLPWDGLEDLR